MLQHHRLCSTAPEATVELSGLRIERGVVGVLGARDCGELSACGVENIHEVSSVESGAGIMEMSLSHVLVVFFQIFYSGVSLYFFAAVLKCKCIFRSVLQLQYSFVPLRYSEMWLVMDMDRIPSDKARHCICHH